MKKNYNLLTLIISLLVSCNIVGYAQTTYTYTGGVQTYTVPTGVAAITVDLKGAQGGGIECGVGTYQSNGGCGGRLKATVNVTSGHVLNIIVGGKGSNTGAGGYGGGGTDLAYDAIFPGAGGGGGTFVIDVTTGDTLAVAGGGGGGGGEFCVTSGVYGDAGGAGGGLTGGAANSDLCGVGQGGQGGTPTSGGAASTCDGDAGGSGSHGSGGSYPSSGFEGAGGGGGGWWGGGSGASASGGGGGSSYATPGATVLIDSQGTNCSATTTPVNGTAIITIPCTGPSGVTASISPTVACAGSLLTLTGAATGATTYSWTGPGGFTSTLQNPVITVAEGGGGTYIFTAYNATLCPTYTTASVTVSNPIVPFVTPTVATVCNGGNVMLTASVSPSLVNLFPAESWESGVPTAAATPVDGWHYIGGTSGYWFQEAGTSASLPTIGAAESGSYVAEFESFFLGSGQTATIYSPSFSMVSITGATLTFWVYRDVSGYNTAGFNNEGFTVYINNAATITGATTLGKVPRRGGEAITGPLTGTSTTTTSGWFEYTATIPAAFSGATNYIFFDALSKDGDNCYLDNVQLTGYESIAEPVWSPATYLYSNSGLTVPYAGAATDTVYVNPTGITATTVETYSATVTNDSGCAAASTSVVTIYDPSATISGTATICSGGTTNITFTGSAGAVVSYNINGGSTLTATVGAGGTVSVSTGVLYANTTYYLTGVVSGLCSATFDDSAVITVSPPTHIIAGDSSVCVGLTTTLTCTPSGGTWSIPASGSSVASVIAATGVVTGLAGGTTPVSYAAPTTGCLSTTTLTVNPSPTPITGPTAVCVGSTITLSDLPTTGGTWSAAPATFATIDPVSGILTGESAGTEVINYTLPTTCTTTYTVTVNPLPSAITGPDSVCAGLTISLGSSPAGGTWSTAPVAIATINPSLGNLYGNSSGTVTVTYTLGTGCSTDTTILVNPSPTPVTGPTAVCAGSTIPLSDLPTTGGTWSTTSSTFATIDPVSGILTGESNGIATVVYTLPPGGCTATYTVTVNPLPSAITGPDSVCAGLTISLGSSPTGGTWSTAPVAIATIDPSLGILYGSNSGTVTVTYTLGTGCSTDTTVLVNPSPTPITGPTAVCVASTITLSDLPTTGGTWSTTSSTFATIDPVSGILTGENNGIATVVYTLPPGQCTATYTVTVNPLPAAITGPDSVCVGLTVTLGSSPTGGTWSTTDATISTIDPVLGNLYGNSAGTDTVVYTLGTGCLVSRAETVNPLPAPVVGPAAVCAGLTITFTDDTLGGSWSTSPPGTASIDPISGVLTGEAAGSATVTYTIPTGCIATAPVTVNPLPAPITGASAVCLGLTTTLSDLTGTGTWSSSDASVATIDGSGNVTGTGVGLDTITYTLGTGCIETATITVNPLPLPITGPAEVCVNASITMADLTSPGTWSTAPVATATINSISGALTGVASGTVTVIYTLPTSCLTTTVVTVNPIPDSIGGMLAVCEDGGTTDLTEAIMPGTWSISPASIATIDPITGVVTGILTGSATVVFTLPVTGCFIAESFTVNPLPSPITGTPTVCAASSVTLHDATGPGTWSIVPPAVATINSVTGTVTGVSSGTATVTYTLGTGCDVTYTMTVDPQPAAVITPIGDTMLCPGSFVDLTANTGTGLTYQWYDGGAIGGATTSTYIDSIAGNFKVRVTNDFGCSLMSPSMAVTVSSVTASITSAGGATVTCYGTGLLLTANVGPGLSYQWQLNGTSIPGAVSSSYSVADSSGAYTVVVSNTTGCSMTSNTINITVNPSPAGLVTASGPLTFCYGGSVVLTADAGTGYGYQWYNGGGAIAGANAISYTAAVSGSYTVTETNTYGCSTSSAAVNVTAIPLPDATITPTAGESLTFCSGGSVTLNTTAGGGDTYQWYNNGLPVSGATSASYTDTGNGHFTVVITDPFGCTASTPSATLVTVVAGPVIEALTPTTFCWGGSVTLAVNVVSATGGITYQWSDNGTPVSGATSAVLNTSLPGNYTCVVDLPGTCTISTVPLTVIENPLPNPLITWDGLRLHTGSFYVTYQWYENTVGISGATADSVQPTTPGSYAVAVTDTNGCQSVSDVFVLSSADLSALGVGTVNKGAITIYPNPAQTLLHIASAVTVRAQISSIDGRTVLEQSQAKDIDISGLADGVYMIMLYDDNGLMVKTEKLVKTGN